jgi:outer membrane protein
MTAGRRRPFKETIMAFKAGTVRDAIGTGFTHGWLLAVCALLLAAVIQPAIAQSDQPAPAAEARCISFEEAVQIALTQNSDLRRAQNASTVNRAAVNEARMRFFPDLRLSVSGDESYGRFFSESEGRLLNESSESFGARVASSVVLFDGLANLSNLRQAGLEEDAGRLDIERTRQTVVFQVVSGYLALIEAGEQVRIRDENMRAQQDQERLVSALVEGGKRPISDLYQQQAQVAAARLSLVEARRDHELRQVDLVQALQLDPAREYIFEIPELPESYDSQADMEVGSLLDHAFQQRPDLDAISRRLEASREGETAAGAGRWPTVTFSASYGSNYSSTGQDGFWDQLDARRTGSMGLGVSVPLFDRFATRYDQQRARIATANARLALADLRQEVALQVRRAVLDWKAAHERLMAAEAQVQAARQALDATQERYEAGVATLYEVSQARADLVAATSTQVSASYNLLWQKRLLDYYVGDLDPGSGLM